MDLPLPARHREGFLREIDNRSSRAGSAAVGIPSPGALGRGVGAPSGTLVFINLVGGVDGLSVVVPHADPAYAIRRPALAISPPGERYGAIDMGRGLGLHPALSPLHAMFGRSDHLALICGVGVPDVHGGDRNHLPSREFLHQGGRDEPDGWATRLLRFEGLGSESVWSFGSAPHAMFDGLATAMVEQVPVVSVGRHFDESPPPIDPRNSHVGTLGGSSIEARWSDASWTAPADRLARGYPEGGLSRSLAATADMIRTDPRLRIVAIDHPGYDTHVDQGDGRAGVLTHKLDRLARALTAFWSDLARTRGTGDGRDPGPVTIILVSEFGRAIDENDSGGTEHGRGGVAIVLGDQVVGGIHGDMPSLADDEVWPVTVDVRRVLADAAASHGFRPWRGGVFQQLPLPNRSLGLLLSP
ncbi:MAG: DUF1501 domain-containing protein [Acidimicrobiales bacterium]